MSDVQYSIELLKSDNPNQRYDACEQLRVSRQPLSQDAIDALSSATNDHNPDVADAARRALALHAPQLKPDTTSEKETGDKAATDTITAKRQQGAIGGALGSVAGIFLKGILDIELPTEIALANMLFCFLPAPILVGIIGVFLGSYFAKKSGKTVIGTTFLVSLAVGFIIGFLFFTFYVPI